MNPVIKIIDLSENLSRAMIKEDNILLMYDIVTEKDNINIQRINHLILYGLDKDAKYPNKEKIDIEKRIYILDPYLKEEHFGESLNKYGIKLKEVTRLNGNIYVSSDFDISKKKEDTLREFILEKIS